MVEEIYSNLCVFQIICFIYFPDLVKSIKDAWIIGDHLARIAYPYLQQLEQDHKMGYENYLHENYDHYAYFPSFTESNVLAMIRNAFIEGLNKRCKLPNVVIILTDEQLLTEDPLYLPSEFERKIKWVIRELDINIKIRKGSLPSKAYVMGQPRIMWVQAFRTKRGSKIHPDQLLKFNNILRRTCMAKAIYTIPVDDSAFRCYDVDGRTQIAEGFKFLWHEIINGLKFHDDRDKRYKVNQLVDERLKQMNLDKQVREENRDHTLKSLQRNLPTVFDNNNTHGSCQRNDRSRDRPLVRDRRGRSQSSDRNQHRNRSLKQHWDGNTHRQQRDHNPTRYSNNYH